ncbi:hypothetical protein M758_3G096400 [Ceratodon purpureus]|uniref:Secreted protein n=1 Tax=Ceratodon purpureus TaxID=3225 RepID=A0A8T0IIZ1_CERPU|nr:hypothetical protein KC19_3G093400 [Ceratodon purpureus]KAG0622425.1 hypothetical protein M758_3G096400 [Ceratodon purpureus]
MKIHLLVILFTVRLSSPSQITPSATVVAQKTNTVVNERQPPKQLKHHTIEDVLLLKRDASDQPGDRSKSGLGWQSYYMSTGHSRSLGGPN